MSDEDLRELERRAPLDAASGVRFARALARRGEVARASRELARVVEECPSDSEALAELDVLTRGGADPSAPWPGGHGDGRQTRRSTAAGPTSGGHLARLKVDASRLAKGIAVDVTGSLRVSGTWGMANHLLRIDSTTGEVRGEEGEILGEPLLVAGGVVARYELRDKVRITALDARGHGFADGRSPCAVGLGHFVFPKADHRIEARQLPTLDAPLRWAAPIPRPAADVAIGPGARVLVLTTSGLGARGSFHRFELATGKALPAISLDRLGTVPGKVVAAEDGTVFLGLGGSTVALDGEGKELWRHERSGVPAALAGEKAEVLVVCEHGSFTPRGLDARTGAVLWESRDACLNGLPKVDVSGRIFWRREEELVALDARTGQVVFQALVAPGYWDFAFDGKGRVLALRYSAAPELIVIGAS